MKKHIFPELETESVDLKQSDRCRCAKSFSSRILSLSIKISICLCLSGCEDKFRIETEVNSDGTIARAIYQPARRTPESARACDLWGKATIAKEIKDCEWSGSIRDLPINPPLDRDKAKYFAAWGEFSSGDQIPDHFVVKAPDLQVTAGLAQQSVRNDYGLFVEHRWEETLTDVVDLSSLGKAKREYAAFMGKIVTEVVEDTLGQEYDVTALNAWILEEVSLFAMDYFDLHLFYSMEPVQWTMNDYETKGLQLLRDYGLPELTFDRNDEDALWKGYILPHIAKIASQKLQSKKGSTPLDTRDRAVLVDKIAELLTKVEEAALELAGLESVEEENIFLQSREKIIEAKYGGEEAFEKEHEILLSRLNGVYEETTLAFHCEVSMPGEILETTGSLLDEHTATWSFTASEAYPLGYVMRCRSLESKPELQMRLLGSRSLTDRRDMLKFMDKVDGDEEIRTTLVDCAAAGDLEAFRNLLTKRLHEQQQKENEIAAKISASRIRSVASLLGVEIPKVN